MNGQPINIVLVGAAVDIRYTLPAGGIAVLMIFVALVFRSVGVWLCLIGTPLNLKEKLYCIIAYLPKATVQAAVVQVDGQNITVLKENGKVSIRKSQKKIKLIRLHHINYFALVRTKLCEWGMIPEEEKKV